MPTLLPPKAKLLPEKEHVFVDWLGLWSISLGAAAAAFAMFVCFGARDQLAATWILVAAALMVFLASCASEARRDC